MPDPIVQVETRAGVPVHAFGSEIIPFSRAVIVRFPGNSGGVVWNRPVSVLVGTDGEHEEILRVRDVTRLAEVLILCSGLLGSLLIWLLFQNRKNA
ncbi:MAG: hypothetical protein ACM3PY_09745 [Omnitrophica WOR_2 bacterium]